jgi:hypothetical protein
LVAETRILAPLAAVPAFASRSEATSRNRGLKDTFCHLHILLGRRNADSRPARWVPAFASLSEALNPSRGLKDTFCHLHLRIARNGARLPRAARPRAVTVGLMTLFPICISLSHCTAAPSPRVARP